MPVTITGLPELLNKFKALGTDGERMASAIVNATADNIVKTAKQLAPADLGGIRQGIVKEAVTQFKVKIAATAPESAFQEFGTGGKVDVPADMQETASQFKGGGSGDFAAFVLALTGWVKRHGINPIGNYTVATRSRIGKANKADLDEETAYAIARGILAHGLAPQPFLYPAFVQESAKLLPTLHTGFQELLKNKQA